MSYVQPCFPFLLLLALLAALRLRGSANNRRVWLWMALGAVILFSWPPVAWLLSRALEYPYPPRTLPAGEAGAIVVLASSMYPETPPLPAARAGSDTLERCLYAAWLYSHWKQVPVLASGGGSDAGQPAYSLTMREALRQQGVPPDAIWVEDRSHSTYENALFAARLLREKGIRRIVLVTEAYHMPRAVRCFREQSLEVIPAACGYRTFHRFHLGDLLPGWEPIGWNEDVIHEAVGLGWYRLKGWI
jgi:uncharacterized SAM-binding protein YcdF (DUF218 family)